MHGAWGGKPSTTNRDGRATSNLHYRGNRDAGIAARGNGPSEPISTTFMAIGHSPSQYDTCSGYVSPAPSPPAGGAIVNSSARIEYSYTSLPLSNILMNSAMALCAEPQMLVIGYNYTSSDRVLSTSHALVYKTSKSNVAAGTYIYCQGVRTHLPTLLMPRNA